MNTVTLIGRLTKDPDVRYTESKLAVARFSVAINRGKDRDGNDRGADFPNVVVFGRQAENCGKYLSKGSQVGITGRIQTGSYTNKDNQKVYTTDVIASNVEFLGGSDRQQNNGFSGGFDNQAGSAAIPAGIEQIPDDDELPF